MTSDRTMDQLRHRAKLHLIQRCINVEEYLSQHWEDFEKLAASLKRQKGKAESCKLIEGLMEVQSSSVPDGFAGPLTQGNMASTDLQPRTPIFVSEFMAANLLDEDELDILYHSVVDQLDVLMKGDWKVVRREAAVLHGLIAKLIVLIEGE